MVDSPEKVKQKEQTTEHEEDEDEELTNPNLYEESMAEITLNDTKADGTGHDSDPFDRSDEYDEDVNIEAPPPITPDIPEVSTDVLVSLRNRVGNAEATADVRNPFEDSDQEKKDEKTTTSTQ